MIPIRDLLNLLDEMVGTSLRADPTMFDYWIKEGVSLHPELTPIHKATLARIAAGEAYEFDPRNGAA